MPSNKSARHTIQVNMKQPSKTKTPMKAASQDSISETISFVIKGQLTPIKGTFVPQKVGVGKKLLKLDKKLKGAGDSPRKKAVKVEKPTETVKTVPEAEMKPKRPAQSKLKRNFKAKNNSKLPVEVLLKLPPSKIVKPKGIKNKQNIKLVDDKSQMKTTPKRRKIQKKSVKKISVQSELKEDESTKELNDKKKTIAKLLKQANKVLIHTPTLRNRRKRITTEIKPKNLKKKIVNNKKNIVKTRSNENCDKKPCSFEELKKEPEAVTEEKSEPSSPPANISSKDDFATSDDNNLEELRLSLKKETENKTKSKKCNIKTKKQVQSGKKINKKFNKKVLPKNIKKSRLESHKTRKLKLYGIWNGPKRKRVASLNAIAKVHCLYENEGRISMLDNPETIPIKKEVLEKSDDESISEKSTSPVPQRSLRNVPGLRGVGKHWDMHNASSSSSSDEHSDAEFVTKKITKVKKEPVKKSEENKVLKKRKRKQNEIIMDLKDMVVRKRMASLNATAILAASYSQERRNPKSPKSEEADDSDSSDDDLLSDDEPQRKKCYADDVKEDKGVEVRTKPNKKVAVILNQDTDVTITGVYVNSTTRSTHHEGYCSIAGMQYRISATSHTQTAATAVATETLLQSSSTGGSQENTNTETLTPTGKSYKPLDALSNMRPPSDGAHHGHQSMAPPQQLMGMSPSGVRHGCSSAFTAPHPSAYHHGGPAPPPPPPPPPATMSGEPGYIHGELPFHPGYSSVPNKGELPYYPGFNPTPQKGYYQPAGPLITVPLGHGQPPLAKSAPLSETSPTTPSPLSSHPPHPAPSSNGDSSDSEVIITSITAGKEVPAPPQAHSSYRYSQYPPNVPPPSYSYPYTSHYYHPTPPPTSYPHEVCYSPGPYVHHKFPPTAYRRYLGGPQYYPPNPPPPTQEIYAVPPTHAQPSQQVVTATPVSGSGTAYQPTPGPPPPSSLMDSYPPLVEPYPTHYYPGYPPGPPSTCYSHAPPPRAVPYMNGAYQSCPCPMQSCPKNGLTGPLTGDSKRSSTLPKGGSMPPLPPVALALPKEPTTDGPPSPARGSAGMPPPPSPAGATYRQQPTPPTKQESISPESRPVEKKRQARVGKAMVRSNMQNTMLLMCNPIPVNCVKREIESPKEKEVTVPEKEDVALNVDTKINSEFQNSVPQQVQEEIAPPTETTQLEAPVKIEEQAVEPPKEEEVKLEPVLSTVGENVKVKNMKRKLSLSLERKEEVSVPSPPKKPKVELRTNGSYKNLIKKNTSSIRINNGKRKLIQESKIPRKLFSRASLLSRRKAQEKRKLNASKESTNNNNNNRSKQIKITNTVLTTNNNIEPNFKTMDEDEHLEELAESKENLKRGSATQLNVKSNQKLASIMLDNLIAKNNVDRTIESVISDGIRTNVSRKTDRVKQVKEPLVPTSDGTRRSTKKMCRLLTNRRKSKCKEAMIKIIAAAPLKSTQSLRWSNGWSWEGEPYEAKVFLNSDETTVIRRCYPSMRHHSGDLIETKDCVLLKAGARRNELPFVAKIAALWENLEDGEMMMSLLWYYRPEHTEQGRQPSDQPDEVFASRHKDSNSVACIDDKCFVLTFNEYCRYRKNLRRIDEGIDNQISTSIPLPEPYPRSHRQPPQETKISPEMIFFCRRVYDFRQKRIIKNPT